MATFLESADMSNAKEREIKHIASRAAVRIETMINSINGSIKKNNPNIMTFKINENTKQRMISNLMDCVKYWNGGSKPKQNIQIKKNKKKIFLKVRAFWNHKKAEQLGNHCFCVILSILFQYIASINLPNMMSLYIDIICKLLQETIKYPRTKKLPLICYASFIKANKFKDFCLTFLSILSESNIKYDLPQMTKTAKINGKSQTKYVRDSKRAKKQHQLYLNCLIKLKQQLNESNIRGIQQKIGQFERWIIEHKTSDNNNNNYNQFIFNSSKIVNIANIANIANISRAPSPISVAESNLNRPNYNYNYCCCNINYNQFRNIGINRQIFDNQLYAELNEQNDYNEECQYALYLDCTIDENNGIDIEQDLQ